MSKALISATALLFAVACGPPPIICEEGPAREAIAGVLDDWHQAAAVADFDRYFGHFSDDAVFLGTDATERWSVAEFRDWSRQYFERDSAWTYAASERHVGLDGDCEIAWVDELLENEKYGQLRGTAVLRRTSEEAWKIAHYSMTFLVPNEVAGDVVERIRAGD